VRYTQSFHSYAEKEKALVRKFGKRLFEMGPGGVVKQCFRKSVDTWGAGLCFAEWYLYEGADKPVRENVLHQWIALKGSCHDRLTGIANGVRCLLLLFVMVDMFCALFRKEENSRLLLHLLTAGIVTLLMIWETHPRYTIHYTPALIAVAAIRMAMILDWRPSLGNDKERIGIGWQGKAMLRVEVALKELLADDMDAADNEHELLVRLASEPAPPPRKITTIAIFYHRFYAGGIERVISEQFRYFLESGYKVVLITETPPTDADFPVPAEVPRELVPATVAGRQEALRDIFERHEVDLYYTHASFARQTLWDLLIVRFLLHRRVVIHAHGIFPCSLVWDEDNLQYRIDLYRLADKLIVLTRADVFYYGAYGIDSVYLPNPLPEIDTQDFSADFRFAARTVLAVGRICSVKRTLDVLKVAAELQNIDPTIRFLVIGNHEDKIYWQQVQSFYRGKALGATLNFLPYTTDIAAEYLKGSILVVTSQLEGFPMVMAEAKGFALPVVSYDLPYVEFFRQERSGIITVPQGDYRAMAQEVKRVLDDRVLYDRLSRESRDSYDRIVSENDLKASYEKIVKELENRVDAERHSQCEDARAAFEALVQQMRERCRLVAAREYRLGGEAMRRSLAGRAMKFSLIASAASWPFRMATRTWYTMRTLGVKATWHKIKEKINALQRRFFRK
jgi:glycosyltransferase involved in cell wall biosynthesis